MNRFFHKHKTLLFVSMAVIFVSLLFFGVGSNYLISSPTDVVMKVNGEKIRRGDFDRLMRQIQRQTTEMTPEQRQQAQNEAMRELVRTAVYNQESKKYGIEVPDQELKFAIEHAQAFQKDGHFDASLYMRTLSQAGETSPDEFEKGQRKVMAAAKLNQLLTSAVHVSDIELQEVLPARLALETDPKKRKEMEVDPEKMRDEIKNQEVTWVYQDWLGQINSALKVNFTSDRFRDSLKADAPK